MERRILTGGQVARAVEEAIPRLAFDLPEDIRGALSQALESTRNAREREVLRLLANNARVAAHDRVPICQDTGSVWVCLEAGPDMMLPGDVLAGVDGAVSRAYRDNRLRKSIVGDAFFNRANTGDNTPAFVELRLVERPGARIHVMLKGGGSDNASRVVMLAPGAGKRGIVDALLECVSEKAANACPPLVIGIGIGSTFDKVAGLAKHALMRPLGEPHPSKEADDMERELLDLVNSTGIGAGALGGDFTAIGVRIETAPCHIAALPLAINMGCSAMRRGTYEL